MIVVRHLQTSLNDTVDVLSLRLVQLENDLVEQQEIQEDLEAERAELQTQVIRLELKCKGKHPIIRSITQVVAIQSKCSIHVYNSRFKVPIQ